MMRLALYLLAFLTLLTFARSQQSGACTTEASAYSNCIVTNSDQCACQGEDYTNFQSCDNMQSLCNQLTCCEACSNEGKAFGACMASILQCSSNCGEFSPLAPSPNMFPSLTPPGAAPNTAPTGSGSAIVSTILATFLATVFGVTAAFSS